MKFNDILKELASSDTDVLRICDVNADALLNSEKARGERAESKAQDVLKACAVGASILIGALGFVYTRLSSSPSWAVLLPFLAGILFLLKSVWFNLMVFKPAKLYRATPELIFDVQGKTPVDASRYVIGVKLWLLEMNVPQNTEKLFYLARAIRNFTGFIFTLLLSGIVMIAWSKTGGSPRDYTLYAVEVLALLTVVLLDPIAERISNLWKSPAAK